MAKNTIWSISNSAYGAIVEGVSAIQQRLYNVILTNRGSDPMRPEFGVNTLKYIDLPDSVAIPALKVEILEALEIWMPEIKVKSITVVNGVGKLQFEIFFSLKNGQQISVVLGDTLQNKDIVLNAFFPPNTKGHPYSIILKINGVATGPFPPEYGFATIDELFEWVKDAYGEYGKWILLNDRILLEVNENIDSAGIEIQLLPIVLSKVQVPLLESGYEYRFSMNKGGEVMVSEPQTTVGGLYNWLVDNWSGHGQWVLKYTLPDDSGLFWSNEFSHEYRKRQTGYSIYCMHEREDIARTMIVETL